MIGNDIIDLDLTKIQSNWQRPKFLEKIFTLKERNFIQKAEDPELEVWKLWSRKEAAYKIYNRETGIRGYFPWKIECSVFENSFDSVSIDDKIYFTKTIFTENFVYTIAVKYLIFFSKITEVRTDEKIIKIDGLPCFEKSLKPVSITHHGRFERKITLINS